MQTKTILDALGSHRPNNRMASRSILQIYNLYSLPFERLTVLSMFEVPPQIIWKTYKTYDPEERKEVERSYIVIDSVNYYPDTICDFICLAKCLRKINLSPKFEGNEMIASVLWKRGDYFQ